jgi:hypothetical protein
MGEKSMNKILAKAVVVIFIIIIFTSVINLNVTTVAGSTSPTIAWSLIDSASGTQIVLGLIQTKDGGYATIGYANQLYNPQLTKLDSTGNIEWKKIYDGGLSYGLIQTNDGGFVIGGSVQIVQGDSDFALSKVDSNGNVEWRKTYTIANGLASEMPYTLIQTSDGGYALAGTASYLDHTCSSGWVVKTDSEGNKQWSQEYKNSKSTSSLIYSIVQCDDGGFALAGYFGNPVQDRDAWFIRTDVNGQVEYEKTYDFTNTDFIRTIVKSDDNGFVLCGSTFAPPSGESVGSSPLVFKIDSVGDLVWNQIYDLQQRATQGIIIKSTEGGYAIAGGLISPSPASYQDGMYLMKINSLGVLEWFDSYKGYGRAIATSLIQSSDGGYVVGGGTYVSNALEGDSYVIKTNPNSNSDIIPPSTSLSLSGETSFGDWFTSDVTVNLLATDENSGVASTFYSFDSTNWITYTEPFVLTGNGIKTIYYYSTDLSGNIETQKTASIKIALQVPVSEGVEATILTNGVLSNVLTSPETLGFSISGPSGTNGWVEIMFPKINNTPIQVYVDNVLASPTVTEYETHYLIHLETTFSTHNIVIRFADLQAPTISIANPVAYGLYPTGTNIKYNFDASDNIDAQPTISATITDWNGLSLSVSSEDSFPVTSGVYILTVTATDKSGNSASQSLTFIVYDPSAGFVTGGGWIQSPVGAYADNPSLSGKAEFGFVSKYSQGANVPTGNTEFTFQVADFKFKSSSYDWMVVAGTKAQYKGSGTINGVGDYKFMLTAEDGGNGGQDTFRIKIWEATTDLVVYDNGAQSPLGGGSIILHK